MVSIFRVSKQVVLVALLVYAVLVNLNIFLEPPVVNSEPAAPLSHLAITIINFFTGDTPVFHAVLFVVLVVIQALMINFLVDNHKLLSKSTSLPAFCYILLVALFNKYLFLSPPFFANFAIIFAIGRIFQSYNSKELSPIFDAGFAIGLATLFYLPSLVLGVFIFIAWGLTRVFNWREWVLTLAGILVPYFLILTFYFVTDRLVPFVQSHFLTTTYHEPYTDLKGVEVIVKTTLLLASVLLGMFFLQLNFLKSVVKVRKLMTLMIYLLSISIVAYLFINSFSLEPITLSLIPLAILLAYSFFQITSSFYSEVIHLAFLAVLLFFQYIKF